MNKKLILLLTTILLITVTMSGCFTNSSTEQDTQSKGTGDNVEEALQVINLEFDSDMSSLNSAKMAESYANTIIMETQEMLVRMEEGILKPAGATSWTTSDDGLTWTFEIRDFEWSDGVKVTANDYEYAVKTMLNPDTASPNAGMFYFIKNAKEYNTGSMESETVGVKAVNDTTLEYTLNYPVPYFLQLMNFANLVPLREDIYIAQGDSYGQDETKMVYSGPFTVSDWVKGSKIVLSKNDNYWDKDSVALDQAVINVIKEEPTKMKMFSSGGIDVVTGVKGEYTVALDKDAESGNITSMKGYSPRSAEIIFNTTDPNNFFTNAKIRLAFSISIDREAYVATIGKGNVAAYGWVPYDLLLGDISYRDITEGALKSVMDQDPKALYEEGLKELGLDPSVEQEVTFLVKSSASSERSRGEFYQNLWQEQLGVKVNIDIASDNATFNKSVMGGQYQVCQSGWGADFNDPVNFLEMFETGNGNNGPFFSNEEYDALITKSRVTNDAEERLAIFNRAEEILIAEQAAIAPITYSMKNSYVQNYVIGLELPSFGPKFELKGVSIDK